MNGILMKAFGGTVLAFMLFMMFFTIPLLPGLAAYSDGGDGQWLSTPPKDTQYASQGGSVIPDGEYLWPVPSVNRYSSGFGMRFHPLKGKWRMHYGVDIGAASGSDIIAAEDGTVSFAGNKGDYGKTVIVDHGEGVQSLYAHSSKLLVVAGERIKRGDTIARVGSTGVSTGPHLHFEIRINGNRMDPLPYITSD